MNLYLMPHQNDWHMIAYVYDVRKYIYIVLITNCKVHIANSDIMFLLIRINHYYHLYNLPLLTLRFTDDWLCKVKWHGTKVAKPYEIESIFLPRTDFSHPPIIGLYSFFFVFIFVLLLLYVQLKLILLKSLTEYICETVA